MVILLIIILIIAYQIYAYKYFKSEQFLSIKDKIKNYTEDCNNLNDHIEQLKKTYVDFRQIDYGTAQYIDNSRYNFKRPELKKINNQRNVYNCI